MGATGDVNSTKKTFEPEDPMELVGVGLEEEPDDEALDDMAWSIVEEYVRMGWSGDRILRLFQSPAFRMTHNILRVKGEEYVRGLVASVDEIRSELDRQMGALR